jgi:hypothetical protein
VPVDVSLIVSPVFRYAKWPAVIPNNPVPRGKQPELFPIECLTIMEDQRVPMEKMSKDLSNKLLKVALAPLLTY